MKIKTWMLCGWFALVALFIPPVLTLAQVPKMGLSGAGINTPNPTTHLRVSGLSPEQRLIILDQKEFKVERLLESIQNNKPLKGLE